MLVLSVVDSTSGAFHFGLSASSRFDPDSLGSFAIRAIPAESPGFDPASVARVSFELRDGSGTLLAQATDVQAPFDFVGQGATVLDALASGQYTLTATALTSASAVVGTPVATAFTLGADSDFAGFRVQAEETAGAGDIGGDGNVASTGSASGATPVVKKLGAGVTGNDVTHADAADNDGYVDFGSGTGEYAQFTITVPEAGQYDIDFGYALGGTAATAQNRSMELRVNGQVFDRHFAFANTNPTDTGANFATYSESSARVTLAAGTNTIRLTTNGLSGPNLDYLDVRPADATHVVIQAESLVAAAPITQDGTVARPITEAYVTARNGAVGANTETFRVGAEGDSYLDWASTVTSVDVPVTVEVAGTYAMTITYANGGATNRPLSLTRASDGSPLGSFAFAPTVTPAGRTTLSPWEGWTVSQTVNVTLAAGTTTLRLTGDGLSGGPNLDKIDFVLSAASLSSVELDHAAVVENAPGAVVGNLSVNGGHDLGASYATDDARFVVSGHQLKLADGVSLDFEAAKSVNVTVTATTAAGTKAQSFAIAVGNDATDDASVPTDTTADQGGDLALAPVQSSVNGETGLSAVSFRLTGVDADITGFAVSLDAGESFQTATATADGPGAYILTIDLSTYHGAPQGIAVVRVTDGAGNQASAEGTVAITYPPAGFSAEIQAETFTVIDTVGTTGLFLTQARIPGNTETVTADRPTGLWAGHTGQGYMDMGQDVGDAVSFTLDVPTAGTYTIGFRYGNGGTADRPMAFSVDGGATQTLAFAPGTAWTDWRTQTVEVTLAAGSHTFKLANTIGTGPNIDRVNIAGSTADTSADADGNLALDLVSMENPAASVFHVTGADADIAGYAVRINGGALHAVTPDASGNFTLDLSGLAAGYASVALVVTDGHANEASVTAMFQVDPEGPAPFSTVVQAEAFTILDTTGTTPTNGLTVVRDASNPETGVPETGADGLWDGFSGSGYVDMGTNAGDAVRFSVTAPTEGDYTLTFRYAAGGTAARPMILSLDGTTVTTVPFAATTSFGNWTDVSVNVHLTAGARTFTLANQGATGPNLDRVTISNQGADTTADADHNLALTAVDITDPAAAVFAVAGVDTDIVSLAVRVNGGPLQPVLPGAGGQFTLDLSALSAGNAAVSLVVTDGAGNQADATASVTIGNPTAYSVVIQAETFAIHDTTGTDAASGLTVVRDPSNPESITADRPNGLWQNYSGTGYLDMGSQAGDAAGFTIEAPSDGLYTLTFRYANGGTAARPMSLMLDGASVATIPFTSTTTFGNWVEVSVDVEVTAGSRTFSLSNQGTTGPNIDRVTITNNVEDVTEPGHRDVIKIDFQDGTVPNVPGWLVDNFQGYGDRGNGHTYGWVTEASAIDSDGTANTPINGANYPAIAINDRTGAPYDGYDQRLTDYAHFNLGSYPSGAGSRVAWEMAVDNGWYEVTAAVGDTGGPNDSINKLYIEGELSSNYTPTDLYKTELVTKLVHVTDGHLTLSAQGGTLTEIQYLEVRNLPDLTPGNGVEAPADYAKFVDPRAVTQEGSDVFYTQLNPSEGFASGVDPSADIFLGINVVSGRGGVALHSLTDGSFKLVETLTGREVAISANTTAGSDSVTLSPVGQLKPLTSYTLIVDGAVDQGPIGDENAPGREFQKMTSTFVTGEAREVEAREVAFDDVVMINGAADGAYQYTSIELAPDGKHLYVATLQGDILRWQIDPATGSVIKSSLETFTPGGDFNEGGGRRGIVGLAFDPTDPDTIWITDNYPVPLDGRNDNVPDFSGRVSKVTLGTNDSLSNATISTYITGLPRSNGDHVTNSIEFRANPDYNATSNPGVPQYLMYLSQGSNSAMGAADSAWGLRPERLLNAAILEIDPTRTAPTGGFNVSTEPLPADGLNRRFADTDNNLKNGGILITSGEYTGKYLHFDAQGVASVRAGTLASSALVKEFYDPYDSGAVLKIYAEGTRNAYDLVWHSNGSLYVPTNGSAAGGSVPDDPTTAVNEGLTNVALQQDYLFKVSEDGYYGHPNPLRGDFILNGGNPTAGTDPNQATTAYPVGTQPGAGYVVADAYGLGFNRSPNGAVEYTSNVFGSSLKGAVLFTEYSGGNDVRAVLLDASGHVVSDFVLRDLQGNVINSYPDPLDVIINPATGQIYLLTLNRANGQSQIVRLDPVPGGSVGDHTADVGGDLAITPVNLDDLSAAVFTVTGLDTDITSLKVSFDGGVTTRVITPANGQVTLDLTGLGFGTKTATLQAQDASGNIATVAKSFVLNEHGTSFVSLVTIQAEDKTPLDGTAVTHATGSGAQIQIRDASNLEAAGTTGLVNGLRPGAFGTDGNTNNLDGTPGGYADFGSTNSDFLTFNFTVPAGQEGEAVLRFRYANGNATGNRPLSVEVNGVNTGNANFAPTAGATADERWANWGIQEVNVTLKAGANTITLHSVSNTGPNIDQMEVLVASAFDPDYASIQGSARIELEQTADHSTRTVSNSAVEFYLKVQDSGLYVLDVAANSGAPDGQGLTYYVNGVKVGTSTFPGVGDAGERSVMVELAAGTEYQVRVVSTAPGASALDYLDVRQAPANANADIAVQSLDAGFYGDRLHFSWMDNPNAVATDGSPRDFKENASVRISNTGTEPLQILDAQLTGPFKLANPAAFQNLVIAAGQSVDVEVLFNRSAYTSGNNGVTGVFKGELKLTTNDADSPVASIDLAGFWQFRNEGGWEPNVNEVWELFGFGTRVAGMPLVDSQATSPLNNHDIYEAVNNLEVLSPYWRLADGVTEAKVTQLAAFHSAGGANFAIHGPGALTPQVILSQQADNQNSTILPLQANGSFASATFNNVTIPNSWIGDDVFGIRVAGYSSDPTLNTPPADGFVLPEGVQRGHFTRIFTALDAEGHVIPNTYLVIQDFSGINYDYNDDMFVISGITPVGTGKALTISGLDTAAADDRLVFTNIDRPNTNAATTAIGGQEFRDDAVITLTNNGFLAVNIASMTLGGPNASAFQIVNAPTSIAAGASVQVTVRFIGHDTVDDNAAVLFKGTLTIDSDAYQGDKVIQLAGLAQYQSEGGEEPTVAQIVDAFGYTTDTGGAALNNNAVVETVGDEVLMPYLERLDGSKPIEIVQIAAFLNQNNIERLSMHSVTSGVTKTHLLANDDNQGQTVLPDGLKVGVGDTGSVSRATITSTDPFGLYVSVDGKPAFSSWSDPKANDIDPVIGNQFSAGQGHLIRYFQAKDAAGHVIPGTYIGLQDYPGPSGNYDYNDLVFVITNVKGHTLTSAEDANNDGINDALQLDTDNDGTVNFFDPTNVPPSPQTPYGGTAPSFTAGALTVLANTFDEGGQGVSYNDNAGLDGGTTSFRPGRAVEFTGTANDVGYVRPGEWLEYTINVPESGVYDLSVLAKTPLPGVTVTASLADGTVLGTITLVDGDTTGSSFSKAAFANSPAASISLAEGLQTIRLTFSGTPASTGYLMDLRSLTLVEHETPQPVTQTPYGGTAPVFAGDTLTIRANTFDDGGQGVAYNDNAGLDGGKTAFRPGRDVELTNSANDLGYVKSGEWVEYTITTPKAGIYDLSLLARTGIAGVTVSVSLGDGPSLGTIALVDGNASGTALSGSSFVNTAAAHIALGAGEQTIRLSFSGTGAANVNLMELRSLTLVAPDDATPVTQTPFGGTAPVIGDDPVTILARNYDNGGEGVAYHDQAGLQGGTNGGRAGSAVEVTAGGAVGWVQNGEWLEYTINVEEAGSHTLHFNTAFGATGSRSITATFEKNGAVYETATATTPTTSSWTTFVNGQDVTVDLQAGVQVVRIAMNGGAQDVQSFTLERQDGGPVDPDPDPSVIGQSGSVTVTQANKNKWYHVTFDAAIDDAVVVMGPATTNNKEPVTFQIRNVTSTGFDYQLDEWDYLNGAHSAETVGWMAMKAGVHTLANGQVVAAGHATAGAAASTVAFGETFDAAPVVLAQVKGQTTSGAVTDRVGSVGTAGFSLQLQEEQKADGVMPARSVDWIALEKGGSTAGGMIVGATGVNATNAAKAIAFGGSFDAPLDFIADLQTRNDMDPATVRLNSLTASGASVFVEEEKSADAEVVHAAEDIGYVAHERGLIFGFDHTIV